MNASRALHRPFLLAALSFLGAAAQLAPTAAAQSGSALAFNPFRNAEVNVSLAAPEGPFTLEAWVFFSGDPDAYGYFTIMEFGDDLPFFGKIGDGLGVENTVFAQEPLPAGSWQHAAYAYDGTTSRLFLNGSEVAASTNAPPRGGDVLGIGYGIGDTAWPGYIDEVIVWARARTAEEIASDMDGLSTSEVEDDDLLAYFRFDEGAGQVTANEKASGPAGTLGSTTGVDVNDPSWIFIGDANHAPTASSIVEPEAGAAITLTGDGQTSLTVSWEEATDLDGDAVSYRWEATLTPDDFSAPALTVDTEATSLTVTFAALDALLEAAGVGIGASATLYHRVVASDAMQETAGPAAAVTLTRGLIVATEDRSPLLGFTLHGGFPNPSSGTLNLAVDLPWTAAVTVAIYDVTGRQVAVRKETLAAGRGQVVSLDDLQLRSGTYLYRLTAASPTSSVVATGRFTMLK